MDAMPIDTPTPGEWSGTFSQAVTAVLVDGQKIAYTKNSQKQKKLKTDNEDAKNRYVECERYQE